MTWTIQIFHSEYSVSDIPFVAQWGFQAPFFIPCTKRPAPRVAPPNRRKTSTLVTGNARRAAAPWFARTGRPSWINTGNMTGSAQCGLTGWPPGSHTQPLSRGRTRGAVRVNDGRQKTNVSALHTLRSGMRFVMAGFSSSLAGFAVRWKLKGTTRTMMHRWPWCGSVLNTTNSCTQNTNPTHETKNPPNGAAGSSKGWAVRPVTVRPACAGSAVNPCHSWAFGSRLEWRSHPAFTGHQFYITPPRLPAAVRRPPRCPPATHSSGPWPRASAAGSPRGRSACCRCRAWHAAGSGLAFHG